MTIKKIIGGGLLFVGLFSTAFFGYAQDARNLEKDTVSSPIILPSTITRGQLDQIRAIIREQEQAAQQKEQAAQQNLRSVTEQIMAASVRLVGRDSGGLDFGSGTIIDDGSRDGKVKILTCGHIFRDLGPTGVLEATIFTPQGAQTIRTKPITYNFESDVGITQFPRSDLKGVAPFAARVAPAGITLAPGMTVQSVGCGEGNDPTIQTIRVTALGRYMGPDNIECSGVPAQGRSGGGLFTKEGLVVGVCSAADHHDQRGLYAGPRAIQHMLDEAQLSHLYESRQPVVVAPSSPSPVSPPPTSIIPSPFEAPVTTVTTICPIKKKEGVYTCHDLITGALIPLEYRRDGEISREDYQAITRIEKSGKKALVESELVYDENGKVIRSKTIRVREADQKEQSAIKELEKKLGRLSVLPPIQPSEPLPIPPSTSSIIRSPNFIISSSTREISNAVCQVSEQTLRKNPHIARGRRLAAPIDITCTVGQLGAGGATTFHFVRDPVTGETHVVGFKSTVQGSLERILDSVIPHEIQHVVNTLFWRKKLPRWADEGVATLVEHESEQYRQRVIAWRALQSGELIPLGQLVTIMEYPRDRGQMMTLYAEGFMLSDFLKSRLEQKFGLQIPENTEEKNRYENVILGFSLAAEEKGVQSALNTVAFDSHRQSLDGTLDKKYKDLFGINNTLELATQLRRFTEGGVYEKSNDVIRR